MRTKEMYTGSDSPGLTEFLQRPGDRPVVIRPRPARIFKPDLSRTPVRIDLDVLPISAAKSGLFDYLRTQDGYHVIHGSRRRVRCTG